MKISRKNGKRVGRSEKLSIAKNRINDEKTKKKSHLTTIYLIDVIFHRSHKTPLNQRLKVEAYFWKNFSVIARNKPTRPNMYAVFLNSCDRQ